MINLVVFGEVFECELDVARVGDEDAAALHRCLFSLAGQQNDARVLAVQNCAADALGAVLEHKVRAGNVLFNVGGDLRERLFAGVLLGDEDEVAVLPAQLAEVFSALERVGAGAAEDGDHLAAGVFDLRRAVERVKAHAVVRVVDDDGDVLVAALVDLHAARGARLAKARAHILLRHVEHHTDGHGSEGVDMIFLPEKVFDVDFFMKRVKEIVRAKKYCVVAISEGVRLADGRFVCELASEQAAVDAFGHKMMSGSAKYLETLIKNTMCIKARAIEISTLQRCASHFASLTDIEEAFNCGETAVLSAVKENETGRVVCMRRESDVPYKISYETADVHKIANVEKKVPSEWITEDYVATEAVDYIRPLIQGELNPVMNDGLPRQIRL